MRNQLLVYMLALAVALNAYSDFSFSGHVKINEDGTAHVTEKTVFLFETPEERKAFEINMNLGESTILEWKKFSNNIGYHISGIANNSKITAKREFTVSFEAGTVIVEYDTNNLFHQQLVGSRRTTFDLDAGLLSFERTKTGQMSLGNNMDLTFEYPKGSDLLKVAPVYEQEGNLVVWRGPIAGIWEFSYAREIPLSQEVSEFFVDTYNTAIEKLPLLLLSGFSLLVLFVLVKFGRK
ncbi:MAG: hypothetical protein ABIG96_05625 [Candidatus Micrarchaeota archaeon]